MLALLAKVVLLITKIVLKCLKEGKETDHEQQTIHVNTVIVPSTKIRFSGLHIYHIRYGLTSPGGAPCAVRSPPRTHLDVARLFSECDRRSIRRP